MTPFHIRLHKLSQPPPCAGGTLKCNGRSFDALDIVAARIWEPFEISFEDVAARLSRFDRLYFEPDGSFVWVGEWSGADRWQLEGLLCDHRDLLHYLELRGTCPEQAFLRLCDELRPSTGGLMVQLAEQAVYLGEAEFRRMAFSAD
jgi:hypothetical protein